MGPKIFAMNFRGKRIASILENRKKSNGARFAFRKKKILMENVSYNGNNLVLRNEAFCMEKIMLCLVKLSFAAIPSKFSKITKTQCFSTMIKKEIELKY